ncbi:MULTISPECIES: hypothetical protein [unclassified Gilvibacter]|jgi:hypothetical protein|uniref:hypothetical protein n=1 Tax=unclassified Gilvibacter TaxID=2625242 RepID=UPI0012F7CF41|nr:hypothetical protein [Gilvibacter sp. SZ-19]
MIQKILVFVVFAIAVGYLLKKFVWNPIFESRRKPAVGTLDGGKTKCGNKDCGCH